MSGETLTLFEAGEPEHMPPGYKQTEVGVIPEDWRLESVGECSHIVDGDRVVNYPSAGEFHPDGYCLFLNAGNVTKEGFKFSECSFITEEKDQILRKGKLSRWDIVLTTRGTVGNVAIYDSLVPFDVVRINSGMVILRNKLSNLDSRFFYIMLTSATVETQIDRVAFGSAQPQLTVGTVSKFKLPLPPLPEQRAIAAALSDVDDLISSLDALISKKRAVKTATTQQLSPGSGDCPGSAGSGSRGGWEMFH